MKKILLLTAFLSVFYAYSQYADEDVMVYIARYSSVAQQSMKTYKIPASIKLAQGIYSSNAGLSKIAVEANNHFGLLCKPEYTGEKYYETSDRSGDCFRMYSTVEASYLDHDLFLTQRPRYAELFKLDIYDYKAWAEGLQQYGYSANPEYAKHLISLIEKYDLSRFDGVKPVATATVASEVKQPEQPKTETSVSSSTVGQTATPAVATQATVEQTTVVQTSPTENPPKTQTKPARADTVISGIEIVYATASTVNKPKQVQEQPQVQEEQTQEQQVQEQPQVQEQQAQEQPQAQEQQVQKQPEAQPQVQEQPRPKITREPVIRTNVFKAKDLEYKVSYFPYTRRNVYENNKIKFVIAQNGDTYARISWDVQIPESSIRSYNDAYDEYEPEEGEVVYLQMKSTKAEVKYHVLAAGDTFRYLSQKYAVQLKTLIKRNQVPSNGFSVGDVICVDCK